MSQVKNLVDAFDAFIAGCKSDGIWDAIKACCILAGWDGLNGCLVPLKGTAPTNNNFVSGDYSRTAGLVGDGSTKYLDSNRMANADPQNNTHIAVFLSNTGSSVAQARYIGEGITINPYSGSHLGRINNPDRHFTRLNSAAFNITFSIQTGIFAAARANSADVTVRAANNSTITAINSVAPNAVKHLVFANNYGNVPGLFSNARIAFYSIGESLDLALLDTRVTNLITAIGAAIP